MWFWEVFDICDDGFGISERLRVSFNVYIEIYVLNFRFWDLFCNGKLDYEIVEEVKYSFDYESELRRRYFVE